MPLAATARIWGPSWAETRQTGPRPEVSDPANDALVTAGARFSHVPLGPQRSPFRLRFGLLWNHLDPKSATIPTLGTLGENFDAPEPPK